MGIVLRQSEPEFAIVATYYSVAKREPTRRGDMEVTRTDASKSNFLDLVRVLVAKQPSHVVIVAHGTDAGLLMPITDKTADAADNAVIKDLVVLVDEFPAMSSAKVSQFATGYNVSEGEVKDLVKQCHKIRTHDTNCFAVHIRGCKIGAKADNLLSFRKLFLRGGLGTEVPDVVRAVQSSLVASARPKRSSLENCQFPRYATTRVRGHGSRSQPTGPGRGLRRSHFVNAGRD